ncbi:hypothetical protein, partial [Acidisphaera rubrifaciens]|uniref:hypothetical protein n=1 Tax=Acidisphaera rubrifaciens TaxID=50715 RepID=UPI0019D6F4DF
MAMPAPRLLLPPMQPKSAHNNVREGSVRIARRDVLNSIAAAGVAGTLAGTLAGAAALRPSAARADAAAAT